MDSKLFSAAEKTKLVLSVEAETGANRLLERIENEEMGMEVLPDKFVPFSGELEEKDYVSYCGFLHSVSGKKVIRILEECDERELFEL